MISALVISCAKNIACRVGMTGSKAEIAKSSIYSIHSGTSSRVSFFAYLMILKAGFGSSLSQYSECNLNQDRKIEFNSTYILKQTK